MALKSYYLDEKLKKYYSNSLEEEISHKKIDDGLINPLRLISKNEYIQPIFSKKNKDSSFRYNHSYLIIAYNSLIEEKLVTDVKDYFLEKYNLKRNYE